MKVIQSAVYILSVAKIIEMKMAFHLSQHGEKMRLRRRIFNRSARMLEIYESMTYAEVTGRSIEMIL